MDKNIDLEKFKSVIKFSEREWNERGLIPSPPDIIEEMEAVINDFIDFFQNKIDKKQLNHYKLNETLKNYILDSVYHNLKFDTEEREFIYDEMNRVLKLYDLDIYRILDT